MNRSLLSLLLCLPLIGGGMLVPVDEAYAERELSPADRRELKQDVASDRREDKQDVASDRREHKQDVRDDRREDKQDAREERRD